MREHKLCLHEEKQKRLSKPAEVKRSSAYMREHQLCLYEKKQKRLNKPAEVKRSSAYMREHKLCLHEKKKRCCTAQLCVHKILKKG